MPRTRSLETYPNRQFLALVNRCLETNAPVLIPCTRTQAASMRGEMHAWRRAAEAAPEQAALYGIDPMSLRDIALRITPEGMECVPQTMLVTPSLIETALGGSASLVTPAAKALETLRGLMNASDDKELGHGG